MNCTLLQRSDIRKLDKINLRTIGKTQSKVGILLGKNSFIALKLLFTLFLPLLKNLACGNSILLVTPCWKSDMRRLDKIYLSSDYWENCESGLNTQLGRSPPSALKLLVNLFLALLNQLKLCLWCRTSLCLGSFLDSSYMRSM